MSKRTRDYQDDLLSFSETQKHLKLDPSHSDNSFIFSDDVCCEILSFLDGEDCVFILNNCALISKQWFDVVKKHSKLSVKVVNDEMVHKMKSSQFLHCIEEIDFEYDVENVDELLRMDVMQNLQALVLAADQCTTHIKLISQLKHLDALVIHKELLTFVDKKTWEYICGMTQLTTLHVNIEEEDFDITPISQLINLTELEVKTSSAVILSEEAKYLSELSALTHLDISNQSIGDDGFIYLSKLKNLTHLNVTENNIAKGIRHVKDLPNLTELYVDINSIGDYNVKYITELKQLTTLHIRNNEIGLKGTKHICEMKNLTDLSISFEYSETDCLVLICNSLAKLVSLDISENDNSLENYNSLTLLSPSECNFSSCAPGVANSWQKINTSNFSANGTNIKIQHKQ